ncbi:hypothetical protein AAJ76_400032647 [Vairimorpha ceranae]|uniref:Uncharacterized protein n=1 Tax=Vairimorpha ceranae TaxID=40302 RepID=A0A0F9WG33_9MICR|nr:hypothetical protein AAJ76_400032647 [Vairimorpha ceranae]KAF5140819.1 hypothetical protein G9O61_00g010500 [Vairimorpha ceranae]KKO76316.1 hypothetical protein AAJ76_400032647 [Vairimorpha ceranae]
MCSHLSLKDGFCKLCGIQVEEYTLVLPVHTPSNTLITSQKHVHLLNKLLHGLNIFEYKSDILQEYNNKLFKSRLSTKDKLLLCIYKVLRDISYPITFSDLEVYTSKIRSKWFKEYKFIPYNYEYIINIVSRFNNKHLKVDVDDVVNFVYRHSKCPIDRVIKIYLEKSI